MTNIYPQGQDPVTGLGLPLWRELVQIDRTIDDRTGTRWYLVYPADCFDPPLVAVRADNAQDAHELWLERSGIDPPADDDSIAIRPINLLGELTHD